jgi:hypothetical protein
MLRRARLKLSHSCPATTAEQDTVTARGSRTGRDATGRDDAGHDATGRDVAAREPAPSVRLLHRPRGSSSTPSTSSSRSAPEVRPAKQLRKQLSVEVDDARSPPAPPAPPPERSESSRDSSHTTTAPSSTPTQRVGPHHRDHFRTDCARPRHIRVQDVGVLAQDGRAGKTVRTCTVGALRVDGFPPRLVGSTTPARLMTQPRCTTRAVRVAKSRVDSLNILNSHRPIGGAQARAAAA